MMRKGEDRKRSKHTILLAVNVGDGVPGPVHWLAYRSMLGLYNVSAPIGGPVERDNSLIVTVSSNPGQVIGTFY